MTSVLKMIQHYFIGLILEHKSGRNAENTENTGKHSVHGDKANGFDTNNLQQGRKTLTET